MEMGEKNLEMVEKIREKANVTYEEAKDALERNNWDMLDAMVDLERAGRIRKSTGAFSYSDTAQSSEAPDYRTVEATASGGRTEKGKFKTLGEELKKLLQKGLDNSFVVRKDGKTILTLPVLIFVAVLLLAFWVTVPLLIVGMIFHFRYGFEGIDLGSESINQTMDKAADYVDDLVEKYKEDHKKD